MQNLTERVKMAIRDVPDFPKQGIVFKDITPLFLNPQLSKEVAEALAEPYKNLGIDLIVGIESRGFLLGPLMAQILNIPFALVRKKGKLPWQTVAIDYELEYGKATIEMHKDAVKPGDKVLIHDDLLATGGTANAAADLIKTMGGAVAGFAFIIELSFLEGAKNLSHHTSKITNIATF